MNKETALNKIRKVCDGNIPSGLIEKFSKELNSNAEYGADDYKSFLLGVLSGLLLDLQCKLFIKKDEKGVKQICYLISRVQMLRAKSYGVVSAFQDYLEPAACILLSDHAELINEFANHKTAQMIAGEELLLVEAVQKVILNDYFAYHKIYKKFLDDKKLSEYFELDFMAMNGIFEKNKQKIEEAILRVCDENAKRVDDPILQVFLSYPGFVYAKIAWMKGIEVEVDSELIPKEMLPVKPNDEYWEFDFMKKGIFK